VSRLTRPSFSAPNTSKKLDHEQSIYICFGPVTPVPARATTLFVRLDIKAGAKEPRAHGSGIIGPIQM